MPFYNCQYSFIRCDGGGDAIIVGNNGYFARKTAIFIEAPTAGVDFTGGIVSGNTIENAGNGINVVNSGFGGQGVARRVTVVGNQIAGIVRRTINDQGYVPPVGNGAAIIVEGACVVSANVIESAEGFGIIAGMNNAARDLNINGNLILNATVGIGWSNDGSAGEIAITGNQIRSASGGSIVPVFLDADSHYTRVAGSSDYGNRPSAQIGNAFIGDNQAY